MISKRIATTEMYRKALEARTGVEPVMEVLQTSALPLGYRATDVSRRRLLPVLPGRARQVNCWSGQCERSPRKIAGYCFVALGEGGPGRASPLRRPRFLLQAPRPSVLRCCNSCH